MSEPRVRVTGRLIVGLLIVALGVVFTLDQMGVMDSGDVLRWWAVVPLAYGLMRLTGFYCARRTGIGLVFTVGGAWLLLHGLRILVYDPWDFWPVVLIILGVSLVAGSMARARRAGGGEDPSSTLSAFALWSGVTRKVASQDFRGGEVTAIMGGHEIDLRSAKLAEGSAVIDLFVWWGGVDLRVPEDWKVSCEALALLGGIEDASKAPAGEVRGHIILKGLVVMGGVEVKN